MKSEYINLFTAFYNKHSDEFVLILRQEVGTPVKSTISDEWEVSQEIYDIFKGIMTKKSAEQLLEVLQKCIARADNNQEV